MGENPICNLKCKYCHKDYFPVKRDISRIQSLHFVESISMLEKIFIGDKRARKVHFTGRVEPLMVAEEKLIEEVEKINKEFPDIRKCLTTNGFLLEKAVPLLKSLNICKINVSIHEEAFKNPVFVKGLICAIEQNLIVSLNSIVSFKNVNKIHEILKFCKTFGLPVKFFLILGLKKEEGKLLFLQALRNIKNEFF